jgi:hypothetical protein
MRRLIPLASVLACLASLVVSARAQPVAPKKRPPRDVARLSFVSPAVRTQVQGQREWYEALPDQPVERNIRVSTGAQGGAEIATGEQLRIQMEPETALLVRRLPKGARGTGELQLVTGSVLIEIVDSKDIGPLIVHTPVGDVRLRGATVRLVCDAQGRTAIAVYQGLATLRSRRTELVLPVGMGTIAQPGDRDIPLRQLPPAPAWLDGGEAGQPRIALSMGSLRGAARQGELVLNFSPVPGAVRYRVEIAADPQLHDRRVLSETTSSPLRTELTPGLYYARVAALDGDLLAGVPSATQTLYLVAVRSNAALAGQAGLTRNGATSTLQLQRSRAAILKFDSGTLPLSVQFDGQRGETCRGECVFNLGAGDHRFALALNDSSAQLAVAIAGPPPPPPPAVPPPSPPSVEDRVEPVDIAPPLFAPSLPLRTLEPRTRLYALLGVGARAPNHAVDVVRLDLGVEWAFLRRRLSLDLNLPLLYFIDFQSATGEPRSGPALGDMSVGAHALAVNALDGRLRMGALLRAQFPTGTYERGVLPQRSIVIDPALALSVRFWRLGFLTTQGLAASFNLPQSELRYTMGYAGQLQISRVSLVVQFDAALALYGTTLHAFAIGGGLRLRLDASGHFRLLAGSRVALGPASEATYGRYSAQLGFEWVRF